MGNLRSGKFTFGGYCFFGDEPSDDTEGDDFTLSFIGKIALVMN